VGWANAAHALQLVCRLCGLLFFVLALILQEDLLAKWQIPNRNNRGVLPGALTVHGVVKIRNQQDTTAHAI
jgi:hypothetical protein